MFEDTIKLFDINFFNKDLEAFINVLKKRLEAETTTSIVTANPITITKSQADPHFKAAIKAASYVTPDGIGVLLAGKFLNKPLTERVTGYDVMIKLLEVANNNSYTIYLYGAHPRIVLSAVKNIQISYPNVTICGYCDGFQTGEVEQKRLINEIKSQKPDLIFVALGVPKQELWIYNHLDQFDKGIFIGVGGSFDVLSGEVKRSPLLYQKLGVEWLYRMVTQPSRLKRIGFVPEFIRMTLKEKYLKSSEKSGV